MLSLNKGGWRLLKQALLLGLLIIPMFHAVWRRTVGRYDVGPPLAKTLWVEVGNIKQTIPYGNSVLTGINFNTDN